MNNKMKLTKSKKLLVFIICFFVALTITQFIAYSLVRRYEDNSFKRSSESVMSFRVGEVKIGEITYNVEIADTQELRSLGLGNRKSLDKNSGMLFVFDKPSFYKFWMKDTLIPLDIIWIAKSEVEGIKKLKIVEIVEDVLPESYPNQIGGNFKADYVLELNVGEVNKSNIKLGQEVLINN